MLSPPVRMGLHPLLQVICLVAIVTGVSGYSSGAPNGACVTMVPNHPGDAQTSPSPYAISFTPATFTPGGSAVDVTISTNDAANTKFKGFLLTTQSTDNSAVQPGTFSFDSKIAQLTCNDKAVTHINSSDKTSVTFQWTPPATSQGNVSFRATFVQEKETYWVDVRADSSLLNSNPTAPSGTTQAPTATLPPSGRLTTDAACGSAKGCYSKCSGTDCDFVMTWEQGTSDSNVRIKLSGLVGGSQGSYIALGLSKDDKMSDDSVMYCIKEGVYNAYNVDGSKFSQTLATPNAQTGLSDIQATLTDGVLTCSFLRDTAASSNGQQFALDQDYTLFFATGPASPSRIERHSQSPLISSQAASLQDFTVNIGGSADFPVLVKAHGSLMMVAWIFAASLGIIFARHFKTMWEGSSWFGEKVWFQIHRACMIVAFLATVVAFIIIFVEVGGYSEIEGEGYKEAHPIIGIIVTILTVINPVLAVFRPHPGTKNRPIFNWVHWAVGTAAYILGVISIFFGLKMDKAGAPDYAVYILAAFVGWQFLISVLLEIAQCMGRNSVSVEASTPAVMPTTEAMNGQGSSNMYEMSDINGDGASKPPQVAESNFQKQLLIILHVFVVSGFTIALIVVLNIGSDE